MKQELLKKLNGSSYTNDKLKYLETKLYERSEYSSLNKYNRSPYMQSTPCFIQESPIKPMSKRKTRPLKLITKMVIKSQWPPSRKEPIPTSSHPISDPSPTTPTTNSLESTISPSVPIKKLPPSNYLKSTNKTVPSCKVSSPLFKE